MREVGRTKNVTFILADVLHGFGGMQHWAAGRKSCVGEKLLLFWMFCSGSRLMALLIHKRLYPAQIYIETLILCL